MNVSEFRIDRYGPLKIPTHECDGGLEIFHGPNESGKTLLLEALLKLLEPDISSVMGEVDRVSETPSGYVAIETTDGEQVLDEDLRINDLAPIEPIHLRNIFVIRDNDLRLDNEHEFYDSVTEQIGDLHTSEIESIQSRLEELGRVTPTDRRISRADQYDSADEVRSKAADLAEEIREYLESVREDDLDELESEQIQVEAEIRQLRRELERQENAQLAQEYKRLSDRLTAVEETTSELEELADVSREEYQQLDNLRNEIRNSEDQVDTLEENIESLESENQNLRSQLGETEDKLGPLADREEEIEGVSQELDDYHSTEDSAAGATRSKRLASIVAILGIGLGGLATIWGVIQGQPQLIPSILLIGIGVAAVIWYYLNIKNIYQLEREEEALLRRARNAGLAVEDISDIAPEIETFRDELETLEDRSDRLEHEIEVNVDRINDHRDEVGQLRDEIERKREDLNQALREANVSALEEYIEKVEEKEQLESERSPAVQSLVDEFGEPDDEGWDAKLDYWRSEIGDLEREIDLEDIDPSEYDDETHEELSQQVDELTEQKESLDRDLRDHRDEIRRFKDEAQNINAQPFINEAIRLRAETTEGLAQLAEDLERLVAVIERDADVSRMALEIFDDLHDEEEEKITDLFEPDGRASQVFQEITEGRYQEIEYVPNEHTLQVHRDSGEIRTPMELSRGTREQLYLSARISLAEQLLDTEPGFFLLDDAFLPADRDRLSEGFEVLQKLVDEGWQIIYFTAKAEVGVDIADEIGVETHTLETLP